MSSACAISEYIFSSVFIGSSPCRGLFPVALSGVALPALSALPQAFAPFSPLAFSILFFLLALALPLQLGPALCLAAARTCSCRHWWARFLAAFMPDCCCSRARVPRVRPGSPGEGSGFPSLTSPPSSPSPWPRGQGDLSAPVLSLGPLGFCGLHAHGFRLVARPDCTVPPSCAEGFYLLAPVSFFWARRLCLLALGLSCFLSLRGNLAGCDENMRVVIALVTLAVRLMQSHICGYSVQLYEVTGKARCQFRRCSLVNSAGKASSNSRAILASFLFSAPSAAFQSSSRLIFTHEER